jgi:hypothetical protein
MGLRIILVLSLLLIIISCSTVRNGIAANTKPSAATYTPYYFCSRDVEVVWQTQRVEEVLRLSGTVTNHHCVYMHDLVLTIRLLNEISRDVATETLTDFPAYALSWQSVPFQVDLKIPSGNVPKWLHINYAYRVPEELLATRDYAVRVNYPHVGAVNVPL